MAVIPKSNKLAKEDSQPIEIKAPSAYLADKTQIYGVLKLRVVQCLNDFVAILQSTTQSNIALPDQSRYKNEGIVVGVGPGLSDGAGGRLAPCVAIGDVVMFGEKNVVTALESDSPPYAGHRVAIVSERSIICKLPQKVEWEPYAEV